MGKFIGISAIFDIDTNDRGVSPVIGVILMVAITVILAAVIGTFVLDLAGNVEQNASAGVTYDGGDSLTVVSVQNADTLAVSETDDSWDATVGSKSLTSADYTDGNEYTIVATSPDGSTTVVDSFTYQAP